MLYSFGKAGLFLLYTCFLISSQGAFSHSKVVPTPLTDSLRSEKVSGRRVVIYAVEKGETLYSIARKYKMNPKYLIEFNHISKGLILGQEILIPREVYHISPSAEVKSMNPITEVMVKKGETLFSIAHAHGLTLDQLMKANQLQAPVIKLGQILLLPLNNKESPTLVQKKSDHEKDNVKPNGSLLAIPSTGYYTVGMGETVYSIGFKYGVGVEEIRNLNAIQNNEIKVGQILKLKADAHLPQEMVNTIVPEKTINPTLTFNKPSEPKSTTLPSDIAKPESVSISRPFIPNSVPHRSRNIPRAFKEEGMGIWIDNNDLNQAKSVALHRIAPVGTVIKVTNPMTKKSIFVKVVGSFPITDDTKNAVLVISKSAAMLIGAIDPHFRVELSYAY